MLLKRLALGLAAATVMLLGFSGPAAAAMPSNAPRSYVTLWENYGYSGAAYPISDDWTGCRAIPTWFNDLAQSVANNSATPARTIRFYNGGGCTLASYTFYAGTADGQLSASQGDHTYSSYKFIS